MNISDMSQFQCLIILIPTFLFIINENITVMVFNVDCVNAIWTYITINKANELYQLK